MSDGAAGAKWSRRLVLALLLAPALLWLLTLIILPHADLAVLSFRERVAPREYAPSLAQYRTFFGEPLYWHVFVRTALLSAIATLMTLLLAFPIAWIIAKLARGRTSALLFVVCLIPFWVSETVRTLGWMILLRESGVLPAILVHLGITAQPVELLYHDATILVGLVYMSVLSGLQTTAQLHAPAAYRGRVLSFFLVALGVAYPIGALAQGPVADHIGVGWTTIAAALTLAAIYALVAWRSPGFVSALVAPEAADEAVVQPAQAAEC